MASAAIVVMVALALSWGFAGGITHPQDVEALMALKAAIDPSSIHATSCLGSWDFSLDPCDAASSSLFVCGFHCSTGEGEDQTSRRVTSLTLDAFGYEGSLSPYVGNLSALQMIDISNNAFRGSIPDAISRLPGLTKLDLSRNSFSGAIPSSIGELSRLQILSLPYNLLEGAIPATITGLVSLQRLSLFNNRLSGSIPAMENLPHLISFDASNNLLSGAIPAALPASLMQLSLRGNQLRGPLPDGLIHLSQLEVMDLSSNSFADAVNGAIFEMPSLQQLNLSNNNFTGIITPDRMNEPGSSTSQLVAIDISYNQIRGELPIFMVQMKKLSALSLRHNFFSGAIPIEYAFKAVAAMVGAQPLMRLYLDGNYLEGEIPGPFLRILPGSIAASFVDNCLLSCPPNLSFCQGGTQRSQSQCKDFKSLP